MQNQNFGPMGGVGRWIDNYFNELAPTPRRQKNKGSARDAL